jgi:hypothetical protein
MARFFGKPSRNSLQIRSKPQLIRHAQAAISSTQPAPSHQNWGEKRASGDEPRVGPVVTSVRRRVWPLFAWTGLAVMIVAVFFSWSVWVRWAIGLGVVVIVMATLFSGGGFWRDAQVGLSNDRNEA